MSLNRIFMFLINPPRGNVRIQKLIAKHIFECSEKRKGEDGKVNIYTSTKLINNLLFVKFLVIWKLQSTYYFLYKTPNKHVCLSVWWNRELTLKCKLKCYVKPMKDPLSVSPSKGNQGTFLGRWKKDPRCGWSRDHPESGR